VTIEHVRRFLLKSSMNKESSANTNEGEGDEQSTGSNKKDGVEENHENEEKGVKDGSLVKQMGDLDVEAEEDNRQLLGDPEASRLYCRYLQSLKLDSKSRDTSARTIVDDYLLLAVYYLLDRYAHYYFSFFFLW